MCLTDFMGEISIRELLALGLLAAIGLTILVNFVVLGKIAIQKFKKWRRNRKIVKKDIYSEGENSTSAKIKM